MRDAVELVLGFPIPDRWLFVLSHPVQAGKSPVEIAADIQWLMAGYDD